jgi:hypothetical protein
MTRVYVLVHGIQALMLADIAVAISAVDLAVEAELPVIRFFSQLAALYPLKTQVLSNS